MFDHMTYPYMGRQKKKEDVSLYDKAMKVFVV